MSVTFVLSYLAIWGIVGAILFSVFVFFAFRTGFVYTGREQDGTLKDKAPLRGYLAMAAFLVATVAFLVAANYPGLSRLLGTVGFGALFLLNLALYLLLFAFDTLFIDGFVIGRWRPAFLHLPEQMDSESMREHMLKSIRPGILFGLIIAGLSAAISYVAFIK